MACPSPGNFHCVPATNSFKDCYFSTLQIYPFSLSCVNPLRAMLASAAAASLLFSLPFLSTSSRKVCASSSLLPLFSSCHTGTPFTRKSEYIELLNFASIVFHLLLDFLVRYPHFDHFSGIDKEKCCLRRFYSIIVRLNQGHTMPF